MSGLIKPAQWALTPALVDPKWEWFWRHAVFAVIPGGGWNSELVARGVGSTATNATFNGVGAPGPALESTSVAFGGAFWPRPPEIDARINRDFTILIYADITGLGSFSHIVSVPWRTSVWESPFAKISFHRDGTTSEGRLQYTNTSVIGKVADSQSGYLLTTDGPTLYGATRDASGDLASFYKDGLLHSTGTFGDSSDIGTNEPSDVSVLQRHSQQAGAESITGKCFWAAILDVNVSAEQHGMLAVGG